MVHAFSNEHRLTLENDTGECVRACKKSKLGRRTTLPIELFCENVCNSIYYQNLKFILNSIICNIIYAR